MKTGIITSKMTNSKKKPPAKYVAYLRAKDTKTGKVTPWNAFGYMYSSSDKKDFIENNITSKKHNIAKKNDFWEQESFGNETRIMEYKIVPKKTK